jgi:hypothetical protein
MLNAWTVRILEEAGESVVGSNLRTVNEASESSGPVTPCGIEDVRPNLANPNVGAIPRAGDL